jgi:predicted metal-dependent phosphoesterase TrpH
MMADPTPTAAEPPIDRPAVARRCIDLHAHSTASDGALAPADLVAAAAAAGVTTLALTDHDTLRGIAAATTAGAAQGVRVVPGIELSTGWNGSTLHVLGLGIDAACATLGARVEAQREARIARADEIAARLEHAGCGDAVAIARVSGERALTRTHFAAGLVASGRCRDQQQAFDHLLGRGRPAFVTGAWTPLAEALAWIVEAGGVASLAHPLRYRFSGGALRRLCDEFRSGGGGALEVVTGRAQPDQVHALAQHARRAGLAATRGSDFHGPGAPWAMLGALSDLPPGIDDLAERFA